MNERRTLLRERARKPENLLIPPTATLREAMAAIDREGIELAFVGRPGTAVLGTLSDGDIRRAILSGAPLDKPRVSAAMNRQFVWVGPDVGRAEVLDLMRSLGIGVVPVLDRARRLVGVHLLYELIGATPKPNCAVIMAGGRGTRLGPLTKEVPKPMLLVAGRPILERLVLQLVGAGIRRIHLAINYLGHVIEEHFGDGSRFGCEIDYLRERKPLGTGGPLRLLAARDRVDPVLVLNGDLVTEIDISRLLRFHQHGGYAMSVALKPWQIEVPFGVGRIRGEQLLEIREKPQYQQLVNAGIYVVSQRAFALVPRGRASSMLDLFDACRRRRWRVGAFQMTGDWVDVGQPETLRKARGA